MRGYYRALAIASLIALASCGKEKEKDPTKWYSKVEFATQIVKPERGKINFAGFEPLLKAISDVQKDFASRRPPPLARAA